MYESRIGLNLEGCSMIFATESEIYKDISHDVQCPYFLWRE